MARTESPLTKRGVELIRTGRALREVSELLRIDKSTLVRACKRAGLVLPRGRRPATREIDAGEPIGIADGLTALSPCSCSSSARSSSRPARR